MLRYKMGRSILAKRNRRTKRSNVSKKMQRLKRSVSKAKKSLKSKRTRRANKRRNKDRSRKTKRSLGGVKRSMRMKGGVDHGHETYINTIGGDEPIDEFLSRFNLGHLVATFKENGYNFVRDLQGAEVDSEKLRVLGINDMNTQENVLYGSKKLYIIGMPIRDFLLRFRLGHLADTFKENDYNFVGDLLEVGIKLEDLEELGIDAVDKRSIVLAELEKYTIDEPIGFFLLRFNLGDLAATFEEKGYKSVRDLLGAGINSEKLRVLGINDVNTRNSVLYVLRHM